MNSRLSGCFLIALLFFLPFGITSCKQDDIFVDPAYVFIKWSQAVRTLDYTKYSQCEAFPRSTDVFRQLYGDYYYTDLITRDIGKFDVNDVKKDIDGSTFRHRMVYFECNRVERKSGKIVETMKGEVEFIQYTEKPLSGRGWLMYNRTIVRSGHGG